MRELKGVHMLLRGVLGRASQVRAAEGQGRDQDIKVASGKGMKGT